MTSQAPERPAGPTRPARDNRRTRHGVEWNDPYGWLQSPDALESLLTEERDHAGAVLAPLGPTTDALVAKLGRRTIDTELGFAQLRGDAWYVVTIPDGARYPRIVVSADAALGRAGNRIPTAEDVAATGDVLVDLGTLVTGSDVNLGTVQVSPCGRWVAWTEDPTGAERFSVHVALVQDGEVRAARQLAHDSSPTVTFDADGRYLFTIARDSRNRGATLWRHDLVRNDSEALLHESDPTRRVRVELTLSGEFLVVTRASRKASSCAVMRPGDRAEALQPVASGPGSTSVAHVVLDTEDHLLVTTTDERGQESWLVALSGGTPDPRERWRSVLRFGPGEAVSPPLVLRDHVILGRRAEGHDELLVSPWQNFTGADIQMVPIRLADVIGLRIVVQPEWTDSSLVVSPTSYVRAKVAYRIDLTAPGAPPSLVSGSVAEAEVYSETVVHAPSTDGTEVPVTLVRRRNATGPAPTYIIGYGAYGVVSPPAYNPMLTFLLDRGFAFAFAHVRGGGELGRTWHEAAQGPSKHRSVDDFVACVDHLVGAGITDPERVVAGGGSAGALLVGAAVNSAPERFCAIVLDVPFLDPLTSMLDPSQPLTISDRLEWGDPIVDPEAFAAILGYAPYNNVRAGTRYPSALVTVRRQDTRVAVVEAVKWAQRVRAETVDPDVTVRVLDGGHTGSAYWLDNIRKLAEDYTWIAHQAEAARIGTSRA